MEALALRTEQGKDLGRGWAGVAQPVGSPRVELGDFACGQDEIVFAQDQAQPSRENVEPVIALVDLLIRLSGGPMGRDDDCVGLQATRTSCQRDEGHPVANDRARPDTRVLGRRHVDQLVQRDLIVASQWKQELKGRAALSRFQPGKGADRDPGREGDLAQGRPPLFAKCPQPGAYRLEYLVERISATGLMREGIIVHNTEC